MRKNKVSNNICISTRDGRTLITPKIPKRNKPLVKVSTEKFVVADKSSGIKTCGIILHSGKIFLGDDVWRLGNRADCCEYPIRQITKKELDQNYIKLNPAYQSWYVFDQAWEGGVVLCASTI